ncbi:GlxA family transcriptional regulator [Jannaschia sp. LMIT008]|uniref:GlxA family transcriptional regulator n=1 Tax=Jannaschia maritima TaxID=3032585 RepID=UPI0028114551|nr:helix-turn-helix domain-containing protein [Jannaschia sp. LMIT008]
MTVRDGRAAPTPHRAAEMEVAILLVPGFSMLSAVTVLEAMRIANRLNDAPVFAWSLQSEGGEAVASSLGVALPVDGPWRPVRSGTYLLVCGGVDIHAAVDAKLLAWLRRCASHGAHLGGLCTGAYALGRAGVLRDTAVTIHWEQREAFAEEFPDIPLSDAPFALDGDVLTSAGGIAGIDLILALLRRRGRGRLADDVAAQLMYVDIHHLQEDADIGLSSRLPVRNPIVAKVATRMEAMVEDVRPISYFAGLGGVSPRQLERLFRKHLGATPMQYYMNLRLDRARRLLIQTDLPLGDIALATGFASPSGLGRKFGPRFGRTPSAYRR